MNLFDHRIRCPMPLNHRKFVFFLHTKWHFVVFIHLNKLCYRYGAIVTWWNPKILKSAICHICCLASRARARAITGLSLSTSYQKRIMHVDLQVIQWWLGSLLSAWINNYIKAWGEIPYPFQDFHVSECILWRQQKLVYEYIVVKNCRQYSSDVNNAWFYTFKTSKNSYLNCILLTEYHTLSFISTLHSLWCLIFLNTKIYLHYILHHFDDVCREKTMTRILNVESNEHTGVTYAFLAQIEPKLASF